MSTFALDRPPGVDVVSFFITARMAGQNDRAAFLSAVTEQCTALLGESANGIVVDDAHTLDLLVPVPVPAAERSRDADRRLILMVHGLDEDAVTDDCGHPELRSFVRGLLADYDAVRAGLILAYSSGPVEGHNNRKVIKGKLYRRARLDLLRTRNPRTLTTICARARLPGVDSVTLSPPRMSITGAY